MATIPSNYRALEKSARHPRSGARLIGSADPAETISVSVRLRRRLDAPPLPDPIALAAAPKGSKPYLSREDFATHYGAAQADIDKITRFAKANSLDVIESSVARRTVVLQGSIGQITKAFAVELDIYETPDERYRGHESNLSVPLEIADAVEGIFGLDNRKMARPGLQKAPIQNLTTPVEATVPLTPPHVAQLFNFPASPTASGETIAIFEFGGGFLLTDVQLFFKSLQLPVPSINVVSVDGATNAPDSTSYTTETLLDIGVAGSTAPGAKLVVYFAPWTEQGWIDVITKAVHDATNNPSVISISYGWPENDTFEGLTWSPAILQAISQTFQEAAALGVTIFVSSGDAGSSCGVGDGKAHVLYPGSDPYVTCCGGTTISNVSGANFTENTWQGTGGGISDIFPPPPWQMAANVPPSANGGGHKGRGVPDVAGNADPSSGYTLFQSGQNIGAVGGTSAVAPFYAGMTALINAGLGEPVGYLNPNLYTMPYSYVFRDINDGISNGAYKSGPGWDPCTGLGSISATALETALCGVGLPVAVADFNNKLYLVWKGMERDDRVWFNSFDGKNWGTQQQVPGILSSTGVALAVYGGKLFMAWKGMLSDQGIYYTTFNGTTWAPQQQVPGVGTSVGPRLAIAGNNLFMAWKGEENDQRIFYSQFNGSTWTAQQAVTNVATSVGPALAVFNNTLYMAWKGMNSDQGIWWSKFTGAGFAPQQQIAGWSTEGPSLVVLGNALYALWKGMSSDQSLWYSTFNGTSWAAQKQIPGVWSSVGPGAAIFNNTLYMAWKGMLGDQRIWFTTFNGTAWAAQQVVPGVGGTSPDLTKTS